MYYFGVENQDFCEDCDRDLDFGRDRYFIDKPYLDGVMTFALCGKCKAYWEAVNEC